MRKLAGLLLAFILIACTKQPGPQVASSSEPAAQVRAAFLKAYNAKDADAVAALYAEDATLVSQNSTYQGRSQIRNWIQQAFDQGSRLEAIDSVREKRSGTLAYSTGRSRRLAGSQVHLGQYLIVIEQIGAEWKIVQHFSVNLP
jgi:ketosteroid isomerase-like protein